MSTTGGPGAATDVTWRDPKRYLWLIGLVVPLFPFIAWGLVEATGLGLLWWTGILLLYVIFPVVDILFGKDSANPPESATAAAGRPLPTAHRPPFRTKALIAAPTEGRTSRCYTTDGCSCAPRALVRTAP
jgi:hypothetical protein